MTTGVLFLLCKWSADILRAMLDCACDPPHLVQSSCNYLARVIVGMVELKHNDLHIVGLSSALLLSHTDYSSPTEE